MFGTSEILLNNQGKFSAKNIIVVRWQQDKYEKEAMEETEGKGKRWKSNIKEGWIKELGCIEIDHLQTSKLSYIEVLY